MKGAVMTGTSSGVRKRIKSRPHYGRRYKSRYKKTEADPPKWMINVALFMKKYCCCCCGNNS